MTNRVEGALRSGDVARAAGVNAETLRYYGRGGLLPRPERTSGGHRLYSADTVLMLRVIKAAQRLGFTLDEVAETNCCPLPFADIASIAIRLREET